MSREGGVNVKGRRCKCRGKRMVTWRASGGKDAEPDKEGPE